MRESREKLQEEYRGKQERRVTETRAAREESQRLHHTIREQLHRIQTILAELAEQATTYLRQCTHSLQESASSDRGHMGVGKLASYLNTEKQCLKHIANLKGEKQSSFSDLYQVLMRYRMEGALRQVRKGQLQQQIKFIEQNVLVKDTVIYSPVSSVVLSPVEDKLEQSRLQQGLIELERVVGLSVPYQATSYTLNQVEMLDSQERRLRQCEEAISRQREEVFGFIGYIQEEITGGVPNSILPLATVPISVSSAPFPEEKVSEGQLKELLDWNIPTPKPIARLGHSFNEGEERIEKLRNRIRKLERGGK